MTQQPDEHKKLWRILLGGCLLLVGLFAAVWLVRQSSGGGVIGCSTNRDYIVNILLVAIAGTIFTLIAIGYINDGSNPSRSQQVKVSVMWFIIFLITIAFNVPCLKQFLSLP